MGPFNLFMALRGAVGILLGYAEQGKRNRKFDEANRRRAEEKAIAEMYPKQHTDPVTGQPVIDNFELYYSDIMKYDAWQVKQWARQGKYNLPLKEN